MILRFTDPSLVESIRAHAREGSPEEVCGLLAGRDVDGERIVEHVFRIRNAHERPVGEYLLDPREQLDVTLHVEDELGLDVVGFYHSHPAGPPRLSATDKARASWPNASYFLAWLRPEEGHGAWRWDAEGNRFREENVVLGEAVRVDASNQAVRTQKP